MPQSSQRPWHFEDIFHQLASINERLADLHSGNQASPAANDAAEVHEFDRRRAAKQIRKVRWTRQKFFGTGLFGEPSWDMLLELYLIELSGKRESVSGLCLASGVPPTTALRHLNNLVDRGWMVRDDDPHDRRRVMVSLSAKGRSTLDQFFNHLAAEVI